MTIQFKLITELTDLGLWRDEAEAIVKEFQADKSTEVMQMRWKDDIDGYPPQMLAMLLAGAKTKAIEWIDRNQPRHFARSFLES